MCERTSAKSWKLKTTDWPNFTFILLCVFSIHAGSSSSAKSKSPTISLPPCTSVVIVGDNLDKSINPRHMTMEHQRKSLHYFHSYAVFNRIDFSDLASDKPIGDVSTLSLSTYLTDATDCAKLHENYAILARVVVEGIPCFRVFHDCVVKHIKHMYSSQMKEKSVVVS